MNYNPGKATLSAKELEEKLFEVSIRPRKWHQHKDILLPAQLSPISETLLFRPERRHRVLELGSGWGEYAHAYLKNKPESDYVAFEIKPDRVLNTLKLIERIPKTHFKIIPVNLNWFLAEILPARSFDQIIINFPDPWPKRRHWKHRLIQPGFPERLAPLLAQDAEVHLATDYGPYARKMLHIFRQSSLFKPLYHSPDYLRESPVEFYRTKFESIHKALGKRPYYMAWKKIAHQKGAF